MVVSLAPYALNPHIYNPSHQAMDPYQLHLADHNYQYFFNTQKAIGSLSSPVIAESEFIDYPRKPDNFVSHLQMQQLPIITGLAMIDPITKLPYEIV